MIWDLHAQEDGIHKRTREPIGGNFQIRQPPTALLNIIPATTNHHVAHECRVASAPPLTPTMPPAGLATAMPTMPILARSRHLGQGDESGGAGSGISAKSDTVTLVHRGLSEVEVNRFTLPFSTIAQVFGLCGMCSSLCHYELFQIMPVSEFHRAVNSMTNIPQSDLRLHSTSGLLPVSYLDTRRLSVSVGIRGGSTIYAVSC